MRRTDVLVIGGGQAGLAASACLTARGIDHVVLERGRVAERWRSSTWDSLHLQTPRWMARLPGWRHTGPGADGFMPVAELVDYLGRYARSFGAPLFEGVRVLGVVPAAGGYTAITDAGAWRCRSVIVATGHCDVPAIPALAASLSPRACSLAPAWYRRPDALPPGGVLVVGASASGVLLAEELRRAGRDVTLAVGRHTRLPRTYRGRDILWWLDAMGTLARPVEAMRDVAAARRAPSMQLVGSAPVRSIDLATLHAAGVRLAGRLVEVAGDTVAFADDLAETTAAADSRARALLARIDAFAAVHGLARGEPTALAPVATTGAPRRLSLAAERITTVLWATGFSRDYHWLRVPGVLADGELVHAGGVTPAPGLYVLGLRNLRRRNSNFLDGVGADAHAVVEHLARRLERRAAA